MTAVFIIALLMSLTMPVYRRSLDRSKCNVCVGNLRNLVTGIQTFHLENEVYPGELEQLLPNRYLDSIPTCPATETDTYSAGYRFNQVTGEFTLSCSGRNHTTMGYGENEPYYSFSYGMGP